RSLDVWGLACSIKAISVLSFDDKQLLFVAIAHGGDDEWKRRRISLWANMPTHDPPLGFRKNLRLRTECRPFKKIQKGLVMLASRRPALLVFCSDRDDMPDGWQRQPSKGRRMSWHSQYSTTTPIVLMACRRTTKSTA